MYSITVEVENDLHQTAWSQQGKNLSEIPLRRDFIGELHEYFIQSKLGIGEYDVHMTIEKDEEYVDSDNCTVKFDGENTTIVEVY